MQQSALVDDIFSQLSPAHCPSNTSAEVQRQVQAYDTERASSLPASPLPPTTLFSSDLLNDFAAAQESITIPTGREMCHSKELAVVSEEKRSQYFVDLVELLQENLNRRETNHLTVQSPNQHLVQEMISQWYRDKDRKNSAIQHQDVSSTAPGFSASEIGPLLLGVLDSFFFVLNSEGLVEFVSDNVINYLHLDKADLLQKSIFNLVAAADQEHFEKLLPDPLASSHSCLVCVVRRCEEHELLASPHLNIGSNKGNESVLRSFSSTSSLPQKVTFYCSVDGTIVAYSESEKMQLIPQDESTEEHLRRKLTDLCADEESKRLLARHIQEVYENGIGSLSQLRLTHPTFHGKEWLVFGALSRLSSESILSESYGPTKGDDGGTNPVVQLEFNAFLVNKLQDSGNMLLKTQARADANERECKAEVVSTNSRIGVNSEVISFNNILNGVPDPIAARSATGRSASESGATVIQASCRQQAQKSGMIDRREMLNQPTEDSTIQEDANSQRTLFSGSSGMLVRCQHAILRHLLNQETAEPNHTNLHADQTAAVTGRGLEVRSVEEESRAVGYSLGSHAYKHTAQHDGYLDGSSQVAMNHLFIPRTTSEVSLGKRRSSAPHDKAKASGALTILNPLTTDDSAARKNNCPKSEQEEKFQHARQSRDNKSLLIKLLEQRSPSTFILQTSTSNLSSSHQMSEHSRLASNVKFSSSKAANEVVHRGGFLQHTSNLQYAENFSRSSSVSTKDPADAVCFRSADQNFMHAQMGCERDYLNATQLGMPQEKHCIPLQQIASTDLSAWCIDSSRMHLASDSYSAEPSTAKIPASDSYLRDRSLHDEMIVHNVQDRLPFAADTNCEAVLHQSMQGSALNIPVAYRRPIICSSALNTGAALPHSICDSIQQCEMLAPTTFEKGHSVEVIDCSEKKVTYTRKIPLCSSSYTPAGHSLGRSICNSMVARKESNVNQKFYTPPISIPSSGVAVNPDCQTTFMRMVEGKKDLRYIIFAIVDASGVKIDPQCKKDYDDMHSRKMYSYLIFRISDDDTTIIVEKKGQRGASYKEFQDELAKAIGSGKECRYGCVDVEFAVQRQGTESTSSIQKVVFVQLCPDDAPVRKRMLYASSVRGLKSCLGLESLMQIQASDISDLDEKAIKHELMTHQRV
ncbi:hypothetical protein M514_00003 [Trichuris suis]|uniref:ADF-H domain-containing protein n=1 Tax=Trichuris suis TaxID=68888 RepID=A0A085NTQ2_9BILA|nr:hypothetical protein M514_00003 [Trichuris suis]